MSKTTSLVQSVKEAIRCLLVDADLELLDINDHRWWFRAVSAGREHLKVLHSSPDKGRSLLKYIVVRSGLSDDEQRGILNKYLVKTKQCKLPRERLAVMRQLLLRYRKVKCADDCTPPSLESVYNIVRQQRIRFDIDRYCFLDETYARDYGKMTLICVGDCYSVHLSEDRRVSVILCDDDSMDLETLFIQASLCGGEHRPRVLSECRIPGVRTKKLDDSESTADVIFAVTEPIVTSLSTYLKNPAEPSEDKTLVLRGIFKLLERMATLKIQHGAVTTQNILRSRSGWFIVDRRILQHCKQEYTQYLYDQPCLYVQSWDTICLYIDTHEQLKFDAAYRRKVLGPLYPEVKISNRNAVFTPKTRTDDESILKFVVDVGNSDVLLETLTATIDVSARSIDMTWTRDLCVETMIERVHYYIPKETLTNRGIHIGRKLGHGANSYIYIVEPGDRVLKLTDTDDDRINIEHRLQDLAHSYGYAPKIHDYFLVNKYASELSGDGLADNLVGIVMERYTKNLRDCIIDAIHQSTHIKETKEVIMQAFSLVRDFARAGFMHRDLRGDNIVVRHDGVAIIDFGMARYVTIPNPIGDPEQCKFNAQIHAAEDLLPTNPSWLKLPALCMSYIYDLMCLYIDTCRLINIYWSLSKDHEEKKFIAELRTYMIEDVLDLLKSTSCPTLSTYFDKVVVNDSRPGTYLSVTLVYVEKVLERAYQTTIDTSLYDFHDKRMRIK